MGSCIPAELKAWVDYVRVSESYDMKALITFLNDVKSKAADGSPVYFTRSTISCLMRYRNRAPDADIEGINTLQLPSSTDLRFGFYRLFHLRDARPADWEWYLERFKALLKLAENDPDNYYHSYTKMPLKDAVEEAKSIWFNVDLPNLEDYILPTRSRANMIIHKGEQHIIDQVMLRKS